MSALQTRLQVLPQPRLWGLWVLSLSLIVLALGFYAINSARFTTDEFTLDQDLSRHHDGIFNVVALSIGTIFSPAGGVLIIAAVSLFLLIVRKSPVNAVAFGAVAASGWLSSQFFKAVIARPRPDPALLFNPLAPETGSNSFPSGHVALAVGLAWAFWFLARKTRWARITAILGICIPLVIAWSRLYIGVHYPSDVVASLLAASAAVVLFAAVWNQYQRRVLPRVPLLGRFGPLAPTVSEDRSANQ
ncbi:phosphatase PAP2 family protein [Arthrobacter cryoconiti]|uniref:Phosphatase PAP2 family protein n=1 Tax=Arthrobacter cryoconiti TaxID=748907 RepID=A0ABV8R0D5_9MICC|nr:phosphatase PAP2 family protein [Arthrobacter cryoconiti]MCC9069272.1 phosphatase PAP2 family protein [Arthrobacter cryoconiti]